MNSPELDTLARSQLLLVTGKGGVGKSTVAAVLGRWLSARERRVLVLEIDPRESLHQLVGVPPSGGEVVAAGKGLAIQNIKPSQALEGLVRERVTIGLLAGKVVRHPVFHQLAEGMPGLKELAVLDHARRLTATGDYDTVVLDAPATGHGVSLVAAPGLISQVIARGPVGELARDLQGMVGDPSRCGIVIAGLAEEMPVQEAIELRQELDRTLGRQPQLLVMNGLYPAYDEERAAAPGATASDAPSSDAMRLWRERRRINERELARLEREWPQGWVELPLLPLDRGPELVAALVERLDSTSQPAAVLAEEEA